MDMYGFEIVDPEGMQDAWIEAMYSADPILKPMSGLETELDSTAKMPPTQPDVELSHFGTVDALEGDESTYMGAVVEGFHCPTSMDAHRAMYYTPEIRKAISSYDPTPMQSSESTELFSLGSEPGGGSRSQFPPDSDTWAQSKPDGMPPTMTAPSHVGSELTRPNIMDTSSDAAILGTNNFVPDAPKSENGLSSTALQPVDSLARRGRHAHRRATAISSHDLSMLLEPPGSSLPSRGHSAPAFAENSPKTYQGQVFLDNDRATLISATECGRGVRFSQNPSTKSHAGYSEDAHTPILSLSEDVCQNLCEKSKENLQTDVPNRLWDPNEHEDFGPSSEVSRKTGPAWLISPRSSSSLPSSTTDLESPLSGDDNSSDIIVTEKEIPSYLAPIMEQSLLQTFFCDYSTVKNDPVDQDGHTQSAPQKQSQAETSNSSEMRPPQNGEASNPRKRQHVDDSGDRSGNGDQDDGDEDRPQKKAALPRDASSNVLWACPFSKWKPLSYQSCHKYMMNDISRVKQHLNRKHQKPFCCPTCSDIFHELDEFYNHVDERTCTKKPKIEIEGITPSQKKVLEQRSDKRQTKKEQWYTIYSVIFPGAPQPSTPYVEGGLSSELLSFQRFMSREGPEIIERTVKAHISETLLPKQDVILSFAQTLFQHAIPAVLQRYERTRPNANTPDSGYASLSSEKLATAAGPQPEPRFVDVIEPNLTLAQAADIGVQQCALSPEKSSNQLLNNISELGDLHEMQPEAQIDRDLLKDLAVVPDPSFGEANTWDPYMHFETDASDMADFNFSMKWNDTPPLE